MTMKRICNWYEISPQAYYQRVSRAKKREAESVIALEEVDKIRSRHSRMGTKKLHMELSPKLAQMGLKIGRDRFHELLREHDLHVKPKKQKGQRTTFAGLWRCPNLVKGLKITAPNQVWVSDITYLWTEEGFRYLSLVTDLYSRCIIGYHLSDSLSAESTLMALKMACKQGIAQIHHSDRGIQYTCCLYREYLTKKGTKSSMGAVGIRQCCG